MSDNEVASKESAINDARHDTMLQNHSERIAALESSTQALLESNAALNASVQTTNKMLAEGFGTMKKLAVGIVGAVCAFLGVGSQTGVM